jgi:hypothetical protein
MWKKERRGHEWSIQIKVVIRTTSTSNQEPIKQPELVDCNHIDRNEMRSKSMFGSRRDHLE